MPCRLHWLRRAQSRLSTLVLALGACSPVPQELTATTEGSSDAGGTTATTTLGPEPTTAPGDAGESTSTSGAAMDTTMGVVETTTDEPTSTAGSSDGESSSSGEPPPDCMNEDGCDSNQLCDDGRCVDACGGRWGVGSYGNCLDDYGDFATTALCGEDHLCVHWADPIEQTSCSFQGCAGACDCPPPPATGNAVVTCGNIAEAPGTNDCYLSCSNGETCPDGMTCTDDAVCTTAVEDLAVYGDCGNIEADCLPPAFCVFIEGTNETVCTTTCTDASDCPNAVPSGGSADPACADVVPDTPGHECYLDCDGPPSCPDDMTCISDTLCMWPS